MKRISLFLIIFLLLFCLSACAPQTEYPQVVATTLPVYEFTARLCQGTDIRVGRLVTESVSCLHDYSLRVDQMRMIERADAVIISGAGLEDFLEDVISGKSVIDASANVHLHGIGGHHHAEHSHDDDPHIWLSPENASVMAQNICAGLIQQHPAYADQFKENLSTLQEDLVSLQNYADTMLNNLSCRQLLTFHDGFGYLAESFHLTVLEAVEEESGSEASAREIIHLANLVTEHELPAVFIERSGSDACAKVISAETGVKIFTLDMAMAGNSYFDAMYHNIDTLKEALK